MSFVSRWRHSHLWLGKYVLAMRSNIVVVSNSLSKPILGCPVTYSPNFYVSIGTSYSGVDVAASVDTEFLTATVLYVFTLVLGIFTAIEHVLAVPSLLTAQKLPLASIGMYTTCFCSHVFPPTLRVAQM